MNKRIDFTQNGGLVHSQDDLEWMQDSYRNAIAALASLCGNNVIVQGVADNGSSYGDGWVVINGELMPFAGGVKNTQIVVIENTGTRPYADGLTKNTLFEKRAVLGVTGGVPFSTFVRLDTLRNMNTNLATALTNATNALSGITAHVARTDNPHNVTKAQVGLGDIPNSISIDPKTDSTETLATTAITRIIYDRSVKYKGSFTLGDINGGYYLIRHNQNLLNYMVIGVIRTNNYNDFGNEWDVQFVIGAINPNDFTLGVNETSRDTQDLVFDYILI